MLLHRFIKIGTFYELYEDDAQIGVDVLNFKMTM
jgi:DNA mismatch repair ATPase MutS